MPSYHIGSKHRALLLQLVIDELEYLESSEDALNIPDFNEDEKIAQLKELKEVFEDETD